MINVYHACITEGQKVHPFDTALSRNRSKSRHDRLATHKDVVICVYFVLWHVHTVVLLVYGLALLALTQQVCAVKRGGSGGSYRTKWHSHFIGRRDWPLHLPLMPSGALAPRPELVESVWDEGREFSFWVQKSVFWQTFTGKCQSSFQLMRFFFNFIINWMPEVKKMRFMSN